MNCTHFKSYYPSSDGLHKIAYYVRFPIGTVRGVVQISHGMCEYFRRYDGLAEFLTGLGFAVCGNDHLGHGDSVNDSSELGYFSPEPWLGKRCRGYVYSHKNDETQLP